MVIIKRSSKIKKTPKINYYDLDGTLSKLNNTFDFILGFFLANKRYLKYIIGKIGLIIIYLNIFIAKRKRRAIAIRFLFDGISKDDLTDYFKTKYKQRFLSSLTLLGKEVYKKNNGDDMLLTGCIEIPARQIANLLGLRRIICTEFRYSDGRIAGIKKDTYADLKARYFKKADEFSIYYTDDPKNEKRIIKMMDKVVLVEN